MASTLPKAHSTKLKTYLRSGRQWFLETPERALEQAYLAAQKIKGLEDEHFDGQKISRESDEHSAVAVKRSKTLSP